MGEKGFMMMCMRHEFFITSSLFVVNLRLFSAFPDISPYMYGYEPSHFIVVTLTEDQYTFM